MVALQRKRVLMSQKKVFIEYCTVLNEQTKSIKKQKSCAV